MWAGGAKSKGCRNAVECDVAMLQYVIVVVVHVVLHAVGSHVVNSPEHSIMLDQDPV